MPAVSGGSFGAGKRPRKVAAPRPKVRPAPRPPKSATPIGPRTVFNTGLGTVHPAGGSAAQRTVRTNAANDRYRSQIISTRQIAQRQEPRILSNPRQDLAAVQRRAAAHHQADMRVKHIALQQVRLVQDQNPNPYKAGRILYGQAVQKLRLVNDIGRLTKQAANTSLPLQHRVGALRALRSRYGIPVTQENFKQFRQAQAFHQFVHSGKEGDTFTLPLHSRGAGLHLTAQTYQLRKQGRTLVPVAVHPNTSLSVGGVLSGHPYRQHGYSPDLTVQQAIRGQTGGIASGFTRAGIDTAHFGAKLIPEGTVGTPVRRAITDIASLGPNTITGLYGLGAAGVQAATGNTKPIRDIAKSFTENDPLGRLIFHGDAKAIAEHPGIFVAELAGGAAAADRLAGRVARGGAPAAVRSVRRAPFTRLARQDRYSKGLVTSKVQMARDARVAAKYNEIRAQALEEVRKARVAQDAGNGDLASGHMKAAHDLAIEAERYNPQRVRGSFDVGSPHKTQGRGDLERLADVREGVSNAAQRQVRGEAIQDVAGKHAFREKNRKPGVIAGNEAVAEVQGMVAEGRVAADRAELTKVANRLEKQEAHLKDHAQIATNRHIVASIRKVLATHTDEQLRLLADDAKRYARVNVGAHEIAKAHGLGTAEEFDMSSAKPFAVEQMGARPNNEGKLSVLRNGQEHVLTLGEIHTAMRNYAAKFPGRAMQPGEQAFISHSSRVKGAGSFNIRADSAKGLSRARRTGSAVVHGTASVGRDAMIGSVVKLRNMANSVTGFRQMIREAAGRDPARHDAATGHTGIIQENTAKAALAKWQEINTDPETGLPRPGAVEGVAVRINPFGGRETQMAHTLHETDEEGFLPGDKHAIGEAMQAALRGEDVGSGPWTVVPKEYANRLLDHARVAGGSSAFLRSITSAFRHTVLPFSPTWLTGNALESLGRGAVAGWRPGDSALEQRVFSEWAKMDPERVRQATLAIGGGHMGSVSTWKVRNTANSLQSGPLRPIREFADKVLAAKRIGKPIQAGADAVRAYTDWMLNDVNGAMEQAIKHGMVGTQMRHLFLPRNLGKTTEEAVRAIAGELHSNPAAVQELIQAVQRAYGAYEHFTPEMRRFITNYTPFGAWVFNAMTFLTRVLPADHPGIVALMAANASATLQFRRDNGLDATIAQEKNSGQVPPFLLGSIPTPAWYARLVGAEPGAPLRLARYTPLGIATDPTSTLGSMFLPQLPLEALQGFDFTGKQLRNKDGSPYDDSQKAGYFAQQFALATIPLFGQLIRGVQKGPLAVINPLQPVARKASSSSSSTSGSGNSWMPSSSGSANAWMPK